MFDMLKSENRSLYITLGLAVAYGLLTRLMFSASDDFRTVSIGFLCGAPMGIGAVAVFFAPDDVRLKPGRAMKLGILASFLTMAGIALANLEIAICIVMASPLFMGVSMIGGIIMSVVLRMHYNGRTNSRTVNLLVLVIVASPFVFTPLETRLEPQTITRTVHNQIVIDAPPEVIWQHIIRVDEITTAEQSGSLFHLLGIPRPLYSTLDEEGLGAVRRGYFENGLSFEETITEWDVHRAVTFDIAVVNRETLPAPLNQIGGQYIDMLDAGYEIKPLDDGRAVLHLRSSYRMTTTFNAYGVLWADLIVRDFQGYLLEVIKDRVITDN